MIRYFAPDAAGSAPQAPRISQIRVSSLLPILRVLDQQKRRADAVLSRNMLSRSLLSDPYTQIPLHRYLAFLEDAAAVCHDPALCARIGTSFRAVDLGPVGLIFGGSASLRRGLERLAGLLNAWQDGTAIRVEPQDEHLVWTYRLDLPEDCPHRQDSEYTLAATIALARDAFGSAGRPVEVHVEHAEPEDVADVADITRILGVRPLFGQTANRLYFDLAAAEKVLRAEDAGLMVILSRHLADLSRAPDGGDLLQQVRSLIRLHLGQRPVNLALIAGELNLSPRSLQRRLSDQDTSLRSLLLEARLELGRTQLRDARTSNAEIARRLGYADGTAFWRAFKKGTGKPPSQHRGG